MTNARQTTRKFASRPKPKPSTSGKAVASIILGVASFFCSFVTGIAAVIVGFLALSNISKSNGRLRGTGLAIAGIVCGGVGTLATIIFMIGILIPAISVVREAARGGTSMGKMSQMALALQNYEAAYQQFPPVGSDERQLSWRVYLLPFMEELELRDQFNFDETWDSPHNATLVEKMPGIFVSPNAVLEPGKTVYVLPTTSAEAFESGQMPAAFVQGDRGAIRGRFTDGTSNTILILEADPSGAVIWTHPNSEWTHDPDDPMRSLHSRQGVILAAFADGSVRAINNQISPNEFNGLITRSGGERVNRDR